MAEDQNQKPQIANASLQAAVAQVIAIGLTAGAVRLGMEAKSIAEAVIPISMALSVLVVAGYSAALTHVNALKAKKSEILAPGLTKLEIPEGKELIVTTAINDPNTPDPPKVLTETTTKAGDLPEVKPVQIFKNLLLSVSMCLTVLLGLAGCTNLTPNQQFDLASHGYEVKRLGYIGGVASGELKPPADGIVRTNILNLNHRLVEAARWLSDNAALADVPGVQIPSLDLWERALSVVGTIVPDVILNVGDLPPPPKRPTIQPPATQPASTQTVPIPIAG